MVWHPLDNHNNTPHRFFRKKHRPDAFFHRQQQTQFCNSTEVSLANSRITATNLQPTLENFAEFWLGSLRSWFCCCSGVDGKAERLTVFGGTLFPVAGRWGRERVIGIGLARDACRHWLKEKSPSWFFPPEY